MEDKKCSKCKAEYPATNFYKQKSSKDGLHAWCKQCHRIGNKPNVLKYLKSNKGEIARKKSLTRNNIVYGIFSNESCLYVGQSKWYLQRKASHKYWSKNPEKAPISHHHLYESLNQHDNLDIRILEYCDIDNLKAKEQTWIDYMCPLYNKK
jgi:hypothetical protein